MLRREIKQGEISSIWRVPVSHQVGLRRGPAVKRANHGVLGGVGPRGWAWSVHRPSGRKGDASIWKAVTGLCKTPFITGFSGRFLLFRAYTYLLFFFFLPVPYCFNNCGFLNMLVAILQGENLFFFSRNHQLFLWIYSRRWTFESFREIEKKKSKWISIWIINLRENVSLSNSESFKWGHDVVL